MKSSRSTTSPASQGINVWLAFACLALAIALPALTLYGLCTTPSEIWLERLGIKPPGQPAFQIALWQSGVAALIGMLPVSAMAYSLFRARLCFLGFARGDTFCLGTVQHLRGFAVGMFAAAVAGLLSPVLISLLLTLGAPAGQRTLSLGIGSNELLMLLFAGIVWQIARVMMQAVELADEHAQIV
jgi:uncharacterized membrane protein YhdT